MMETGTKRQKAQFFTLCGCMFLPLILYFVCPDGKPLKGAFYSEPDVKFTIHSWLDGGFQRKKDKFLDHHFGLHNFLVRIKSEFDFRFLKKSLARFVVVG